MQSATRLPVTLAQDASGDLHRDAGLRGARFTEAVWGLSAVFVVGLAVLGFVIWRGRRKRKRS